MNTKIVTSYDYVISHLGRMDCSLREFSRRSKVHVNTLRAIRDGHANPRISTIHAIFDTLEHLALEGRIK
jgi:predicted transcriptional regulator